MCAALHRLALALLLITGPKLATSGNMVYGENRAEYAALCSFIRLTGRPVEVTTITPADTATYNYIQQLNFTLSPDEWQAKFYKEKDRKTVQENAAAAGLKDVGETEFWSDWAAAAEALKQGTDNQKVKKITTPVLSEIAKQLAAAEVSQIAKSAKAILGQYPTLPAASAALKANPPEQIITAATLGSATATLANILEAVPFGQAVSGARASACTATGTGVNPASTVAVLACLCSEDQNNKVTDGACTEKAEPNSAWDSGTTPPQKADYEKLAKSCGKPPDMPVTAAEIHRAINGVKALIHTDGTDGYLGAFRSTGCSGSSDQGMCVKFTNLATDAGAVKKLTWLTTLETLAGNLNSLADTEQAAVKINKALVEKAEEAAQAIMRARALAVALSKVAAPTKQQITIEVKAQCEKLRSNSTCMAAADNNCKWKGKSETEEECKPNPGTETTAAGTGETAGATADKCAAAQTPEDCAKVTGTKPEGKKAVCGWIDYIDGQGKVEAKCRSSSFLVDKKLALISAAFAALLF